MPFLQVEILCFEKKKTTTSTVNLSREDPYKDRVRKCELHCLLNSFISSGVYIKQTALTKHFLPLVSMLSMERPGL